MRLIDDPTAFLYSTWLPRVSTEISKMGEGSTYRNNLALVKSAMAMLQYFYAFGPQVGRLRSECGTAGAIAGIFKAPFDILADKLRGYIGLTMDMQTQPKKVLKACEALMPHLVHVGLSDVRSGQAGAHRLLDAPGLRAVRQSQAVRVPLLAHAQALHRGVLEERPPDALLRRGQLEPPFRHLPRAARPQHRLPLRPGRHLRGASQAARQVRPQRRHPERDAELGHSRRRCGSSASGSSRKWPKTAATSWTPARSCRTTRASRT